MSFPIFFRLALCAAAFATSGCSHLLYYPNRNLYLDPRKISPKPEDVELRLTGGDRIHGWYFQSETVPAKAVIVFFHGNGQNRSAHVQTLFWVVHEGYDLAVFDYPGYGQSPGQPTPKNTVESAMAALRFAHAQAPRRPLVVYGQSLGGAIALRAVWELREEIPVAQLYVDSSFLSYQKVARKLLASSAWTWLLQPFAWIALSDRWAPGERVADLRSIPLVVIHSKRDEVVPFELGREIFETARGPKELWAKESGGHNETYLSEEGELLKARLRERLPR